MLRTTALFAAVLTSLPITLRADDAVSARVAPYVGARTIVIGHLDVREIDVDDLIELALIVETPPGNVAIPVRERPEVKAAREKLANTKQSLLEAGVGDVFVLLTWDDFPKPRPVFVVPVPDSTPTETVVKLLPEQHEAVVARIRGAVVVGGKEAVERMKSLEPSPRSDLAAGLDAAGHATVRMAVASGPVERKALLAMLPDLPAPLGRRYREVLVRARWFAVAGTAPRQLAAEIGATDREHVEQLQSFLGDVRTFLKEDRRPRRALPGIERLANVIAIGNRGNNVTLDLGPGGAEEFVRILRPEVESVTGAITRGGRMNDLKQLGLAFHNYADTHGPLPPRANADDDGKPLLSWRVLVLPYLGEQKLYERFDLDEPWDSPHNKALLAEMPAVFRMRAVKKGMTTYVRPVAKGAIAKPTEGTRFQDITDGTSNTLLVVDVADELAVPWTKPADWEVNAKDPLKGVVPKGHDGFLATFADGSVRLIAKTRTAADILAYITMNGGEVVRD